MYELQYIFHYILSNIIQNFVTKQIKRWRSGSFALGLGLASAVAAQSKCATCASAIEIQIVFLCVGGFLIIYFNAIACPLEAVSSRQVCLKKWVQSPSV
jgi:hypothetical protein